MTVAADLVISGIQEPVRFVIETKAKIFPPSERFWYFSKKTLYEQFYLRVREVNIQTCSSCIVHLCNSCFVCYIAFLQITNL